MQLFPLTQTDMQNQGEKARELFCQVVMTFIQNYGLQSNGQDRRKEEQKQALMEARLTEDDLKTGKLFLLSLYFPSLPYGLIATLFAIKPKYEVNTYSMIIVQSLMFSRNLKRQCCIFSVFQYNSIITFLL